jgi:hypothetical protein
LARPVDEADPARGLTWFPVASVVAGLALITGVIGVVSLAVIGFDAARSQVLFAEGLAEMMRAGGSGAAIDPAQVQATAAAMVALMPYAFSALWLAGTVGALWLGAKVVRQSDRLARPWPDLTEFRLPPQMLGLFALAVAATLLPGTLGFYARPFVGAIGVAYALVGFAIIHHRLSDSPLKVPLLAVFYGLLVLTALPGLFAMILGVLDPFADLRARSGPRPPGPGPRRDPGGSGPV